MDKETIDRVAENIIKCLINFGVITERQKGSVRFVINTELDREFVRPLENFGVKDLYHLTPKEQEKANAGITI